LCLFSGDIILRETHKLLSEEVEETAEAEEGTWILAETHVFKASEEVAEAKDEKQRLSEEAEEAEEVTKRPMNIHFET